jgi:DNA-binding XRE family transcriptional regulator
MAQLWNNRLTESRINRFRIVFLTVPIIANLGHSTSMEVGIDPDLVLLAEGRALARNGHGARIRQLSGLSQVELARHVGVDASTLSRWESGRRAPRGGNAVGYARALRLLKRV